MSDDFVHDAEIARRWGVSDKTARIAIRAFEKAGGFPPRDPLFGEKRFWPAVQAFMLRRAGLTIGAPAEQPGEENWDAKATKDRWRRRTGVAHAR
jgi:hypothetical protein